MNRTSYLVSFSEGVSQLLAILESSDSKELKLLQLASLSLRSSHWARPSSAARRFSSSIRCRSCSTTILWAKNKCHKSCYLDLTSQERRLQRTTTINLNYINKSISNRLTENILNIYDSFQKQDTHVITFVILLLTMSYYL